MAATTERAFLGAPASAAEARHFASAALADLVAVPAGSSLSEDVELIVSELVTNAVRANSPSVHVALAVEGSRLAIRVTDEATGWPEQREAGIHDTGGRGLPLVSAISSSWGVRMMTTGKVVWAELDVPR